MTGRCLSWLRVVRPGTLRHQQLLNTLNNPSPPVAVSRRLGPTLSSSSSAVQTACYTNAATDTAGEPSFRFFPRRAVMYVPANDERKTNKAASLKVDTIVYDIEDGVAANQKVHLSLSLSFLQMKTLYQLTLTTLYPL